MYFFYFFPAGLDSGQKRSPWVTVTLVATMAAIFAWTRYFPLVFPEHPYRFVFAPGNGNPWSVLTAIFLHGGWLHFLGNMVYLATFGPAIESRLGSLRLLYYFVVFGAWGNVVHGLLGMNGILSGPVGVIGASGAIAGLLAVALVRFSWAKVSVAYWVFAPFQGVNRVGRKYLPVPIAVGLWLLLQVVNGVVALESGSTVSYGAHFGGFGLGLVLALLLGYRGDASADACLRRGAEYLGRGEAFAAEGEFLRYLSLRPDDIEATLQLARARRLGDRRDEADADYGWVFRVLLDDGRVDRALVIFAEAGRGGGGSGLPPEDIAEAAFLFEKQLDYRGAVEAYLDLWRHHPGHGTAELALVRAVVLLHSRLDDDPAACHWLETAWRDLRPGAWRDFLAREFNLRADDDAADPAAGEDRSPAPAV